jgi:hypothetical protein
MCITAVPLARPQSAYVTKIRARTGEKAPLLSTAVIHHMRTTSTQIAIPQHKQLSQTLCLKMTSMAQEHGLLSHGLQAIVVHTSFFRLMRDSTRALQSSSSTKRWAHPLAQCLCLRKNYPGWGKGSDKVQLEGQLVACYSRICPSDS